MDISDENTGGYTRVRDDLRTGGKMKFKTDIPSFEAIKEGARLISVLLALPILLALVVALFLFALKFFLVVVGIYVL